MKSYEAFSLALDESTVQLVIFIRAVTADFDIVEEFLDMASLSSTTTGQDICEQVLKVVEKFELNPAKKLCGVTTDGNPSMTSRINGFPTKFLIAFGAQNVVVSHCIVHQSSGFCKSHEKCNPVLKLHSSTRIKSSPT